MDIKLVSSYDWQVLYVNNELVLQSDIISLDEGLEYFDGTKLDYSYYWTLYDIYNYKLPNNFNDIEFDEDYIWKEREIKL